MDLSRYRLTPSVIEPVSRRCITVSSKPFTLFQLETLHSSSCCTPPAIQVAAGAPEKASTAGRMGLAALHGRLSTSPAGAFIGCNALLIQGVGPYEPVLEYLSLSFSPQSPCTAASIPTPQMLWSGLASQRRL